MADEVKDEPDLEALRMAALNSMRPKQGTGSSSQSAPSTQHQAPPSSHQASVSLNNVQSLLHQASSSLSKPPPSVTGQFRMMGYHPPMQGHPHGGHMVGGQGNSGPHFPPQSLMQPMQPFRQVAPLFSTGSAFGGSRPPFQPGLVSRHAFGLNLIPLNSSANQGLSHRGMTNQGPPHRGMANPRIAHRGGMANPGLAHIGMANQRPSHRGSYHEGPRHMGQRRGRPYSQFNNNRHGNYHPGNSQPGNNRFKMTKATQNPTFRQEAASASAQASKSKASVPDRFKRFESSSSESDDDDDDEEDEKSEGENANEKHESDEATSPVGSGTGIVSPVGSGTGIVSPVGSGTGVVSPEHDPTLEPEKSPSVHDDLGPEPEFEVDLHVDDDDLAELMGDPDNSVNKPSSPVKQTTVKNKEERITDHKPAVTSSTVPTKVNVPSIQRIETVSPVRASNSQPDSHTVNARRSPSPKRIVNSRRSPSPKRPTSPFTSYGSGPGDYKQANRGPRQWSPPSTHRASPHHFERGPPQARSRSGERPRSRSIDRGRPRSPMSSQFRHSPTASQFQPVHGRNRSQSPHFTRRRSRSRSPVYGRNRSPHFTRRRSRSRSPVYVNRRPQDARDLPFRSAAHREPLGHPRPGSPDRGRDNHSRHGTPERGRDTRSRHGTPERGRDGHHGTSDRGRDGHHGPMERGRGHHSPMDRGRGHHGPMDRGRGTRPRYGSPQRGRDSPMFNRGGRDSPMFNRGGRDSPAMYRANDVVHLQPKDHSTDRGRGYGDEMLGAPRADTLSNRRRDEPDVPMNRHRDEPDAHMNRGRPLDDRRPQDPRYSESSERSSRHADRATHQPRSPAARGNGEPEINRLLTQDMSKQDLRMKLKRSAPEPAPQDGGPAKRRSPPGERARTSGPSNKRARTGGSSNDLIPSLLDLGKVPAATSMVAVKAPVTADEKKLEARKRKFAQDRPTEIPATKVISLVSSEETPKNKSVDSAVLNKPLERHRASRKGKRRISLSASSLDDGAPQPQREMVSRSSGADVDKSEVSHHSKGAKEPGNKGRPSALSRLGPPVQSADGNLHPDVRPGLSGRRQEAPKSYDMNVEHDRGDSHTSHPSKAKRGVRKVSASEEKVDLSSKIEGRRGSKISKDKVDRRGKEPRSSKDHKHVAGKFSSEEKLNEKIREIQERNMAILKRNQEIEEDKKKFA